MAKLLQVFLHSDLRCCHDGLAKIAKDNKIDVNRLVPGEFVIFINNEMNRVKLYTANQIVAYLRLKTGKIDLRTIQLIPKSFMASGKIEYHESLKEIIIDKLGKHHAR
jgi:hypothetical protein